MRSEAVDKRVLELAARKADIVCFNRDNSAGMVIPEGNSSSNAAGTLEKVEWIRHAAGDRFEKLVFEIGAYYLSITDDTRQAAEKWGQRLGISPEDAMTNPHVLIGSVEAICDRIEERREMFRISYLTIRDVKIERFRAHRRSSERKMRGCPAVP